MNKFALMSVAALSLTGSFIVSAHASTVKATLAACKASTGCGYSKLPSGDYSGCSPKSKGGNGKCFYCNSSTNSCFQVRRVGNEWKRVLFGGDPVRALNRVSH
jgi:hypothetical protein